MAMRASSLRDSPSPRRTQTTRRSLQGDWHVVGLYTADINASFALWLSPQLLSNTVKSAPKPYLPHKMPPTKHHSAPPRPPRVATAPAERFETAPFTGDRLGLERLRGFEKLENVNLQLRLEEVPGAVEGIFQDSSTFKLHLRLRPNMFMTPLDVVIADFTGDVHYSDAPTWLVRLHDLTDKSSARLRSYRWLERYTFTLLTTPWLQVPYVKAWGEIFHYVGRIKEVCNMRYRPARDPTRPRPRPRPRKSPRDLVEVFGAMSLVEVPGGSSPAPGCVQ
ncbi:hypothetical protein C8Q77DRAFT_1135393 [Trametes polyzona]|nr:hypothetical protein C8Q77DRAFT_1135393 [Trametes polyzona]